MTGSAHTKHARSHTGAVVLVLLCGTACYKDHALPPQIPNGGHVELRLAMNYGSLPFVLGQGYLYPGDRTIHFTRLKVLFSGLGMVDDTHVLVDQFHRSVFMFDPQGPAVLALGSMPAGHMGDLVLRPGAAGVMGLDDPLNADWPLDDADMFVHGDPEQGRYILRLEGYVDMDGDGVFTPGVDSAFVHLPHGQPTPVVQIAPAQQQTMAPGGHVTRILTLDVLFLLLGVDVLEQNEGPGGACDRLVQNLPGALH